MTKIGKLIGSGLLLAALAESATSCIGVIASSNEKIDINITSPAPAAGGCCPGSYRAPFVPYPGYYQNGIIISPPTPNVIIQQGVPTYNGFYSYPNYGFGHPGYGHGPMIFKAPDPPRHNQGRFNQRNNSQPR